MARYLDTLDNKRTPELVHALVLTNSVGLGEVRILEEPRRLVAADLVQLAAERCQIEGFVEVAAESVV